jgi:hypothetical protein
MDSVRHVIGYHLTQGTRIQMRLLAWRLMASACQVIERHLTQQTRVKNALYDVDGNDPFDPILWAGRERPWRNRAR